VEGDQLHWSGQGNCSTKQCYIIFTLNRQRSNYAGAAHLG